MNTRVQSKSDNYDINPNQRTWDRVLYLKYYFLGFISRIVMMQFFELFLICSSIFVLALTLYFKFCVIYNTI